MQDVGESSNRSTLVAIAGDGMSTVDKLVRVVRKDDDDAAQD
jgi:hypothetical protein